MPAISFPRASLAASIAPLSCWLHGKPRATGAWVSRLGGKGRGGETFCVCVGGGDGEGRPLVVRGFSGVPRRRPPPLRTHHPPSWRQRRRGTARTKAWDFVDLAHTTLSPSPRMGPAVGEGGKAGSGLRSVRSSDWRPCRCPCGRGEGWSFTHLRPSASTPDTIRSPWGGVAVAQAPRVAGDFVCGACPDPFPLPPPPAANRPSSTGVALPGTCESVAVWSVKSDTQMEAWLNLGKTLFVIAVLTVGAIMFTRDAELLVIGPIEYMVKMVKSLADDPSKGMLVQADGVDGACRAGLLVHTNKKCYHRVLQPWGEGVVCGGGGGGGAVCGVA
jgi:hypothetical protein